jgi:copper transport protein
LNAVLLPPAIPSHRVVRPLVLAALAVLALARAAAGHAVLQVSSPPHGAVLRTSPDRLDLQFNEAIDSRISTVVLVRDGARIPLEPLSGEGRTITYKVPPLDAGLYIVDWRVISAVDGHLTRGSFAFGVGVAVPSDSAVAAPAAPTWTDVLARWLGLIGVLLLTGGVAAFLWLPIPAAAMRAVRAHLHLIAQVATLLIVSSGVYRLASDALAIAGTTSIAAALGGPLLRVLSVSHDGHDLIFRLTAAIFLMVQLGPERPVERDGLLAILGVLLIGPVLTTHGLSLGLVGSLVSLGHIVAASVWVGGLAFFGTVYLPLVHRVAPDVVRPAALRFSRLALVAVLVLIATGLTQAYFFLGAPSALLGPVYGRVLLVKLIILAPLLALAAANRWGIVPRLAGAARAWRPLLLVVRLETALALTVVLAAAAVAISQPATGPESAGAQAPAREAGESRLIMGGTIAPVNIGVALSPAKQGANRVELSVTAGADKTPIGGPIRFILRLRSLTSDVAAQVMQLDGRDGRAAGDGPFIGAPGWWEVELTVRRPGVQDVSLVLPLLIGQPEGGSNDPQALALLRRAERRTASLTAWQELEHYASGDGFVQTRQYAFVPPDRFEYRTSDGAEGRIVGRKTYTRLRRSKWNIVERPDAVEVRFRFPLASNVAGARLGAKSDLDGRQTQIVTYSDPTGALHFAVWIDLATALPARLFMVGEAHHMATSFFGYNEKITVSPP